MKLPSWWSGGVGVTRLLSIIFSFYSAFSFLEEAAVERLLRAPCLVEVKSERLWALFIVTAALGAGVRRLRMYSFCVAVGSR